MDHLQIEAALLPICLRRESLLAVRLSGSQGRSKDLNVGNLITLDHEINCCVRAIVKLVQFPNL